MERNQKRWVEEEREDDHPKVFAKRLKIFYQTSNDIIKMLNCPIMYLNNSEVQNNEELLELNEFIFEKHEFVF